MSVTAKNFYRRPLPPSCVDFASEEGKRLFRESLLDGNANIYFRLASQFRTQDEPAYCGLSTLEEYLLLQKPRDFPVMVLNALEVDPGRVWKAPWRFYHESMLDCCVPLENVKRKSQITSGSNETIFFNASQKNISKSAELWPYSSTKPEGFLSKLREDVVASVQSDTEVIVASYDRSQLEQTGTGHFSPLAAFHAGTDQVLIMDVARFKYPPHWVTLSRLQQAMCSLDPSTRRPRGYLRLSLRLGSRPLLAFALKTNIGCIDADLATAVLSWKKFLLCDMRADENEELQLCCLKFAQYFSPHAMCCNEKDVRVDKAHSYQDSAESLSEAWRTVCSEVHQTTIAKIFASSAVAALMLAWPFEPGYSERSDRLAELATREVQAFSADTRNEIALLKTQLVVLMECSRGPPFKPDIPKTEPPQCPPQKHCSCINDVKS